VVDLSSLAVDQLESRSGVFVTLFQFKWGELEGGNNLCHVKYI
jgi:hypothetical protein